MPTEELCLYLLLALFAALIVICIGRSKHKKEEFPNGKYDTLKNYNKDPMLDVYEIGLTKKEKNEFLKPQNPSQHYFNKPMLNTNYEFSPNDPDKFTMNDLAMLHANPPPSQPFVPSPPFDLAVPYEAFSGLDSTYNSLDNINASGNFDKFKNAYNPKLMDLPPVVPRDRLLPPDFQARDPYSGYPVGTYLTDENFNKYYKQFVPDYLWCKSGVCGS
jgi:hypothetical protein